MPQDWIKVLFETGALGIFTYVVITMLRTFLDHLAEKNKTFAANVKEFTDHMDRKDKKFTEYLKSRDTDMREQVKEFKTALQENTQAVIALEKKIIN